MMRGGVNLIKGSNIGVGVKNPLSQTYWKHHIIFLSSSITDDSGASPHISLMENDTKQHISINNSDYLSTKPHKM